MQTHLVSISEELRQAVETRGGRLELLADGSIMVTVVGTGVATDQAAQAARCALALRAELSGRPMAIATGRAEVSGRMPAGVLIDRAAQMLAEIGASVRLPPGEWRAAPIAIDEVTAGLLDARFELAETDAGFWLGAEQPLGGGIRRLLGKPTTCVGRDIEMATLTALFAECVDEPRARVERVCRERIEGTAGA